MNGKCRKLVNFRILLRMFLYIPCVDGDRIRRRMFFLWSRPRCELPLASYAILWNFCLCFDLLDGSEKVFTQPGSPHGNLRFLLDRQGSVDVGIPGGEKRTGYCSRGI